MRLCHYFIVVPFSAPIVVSAFRGGPRAAFVVGTSGLSRTSIDVSTHHRMSKAEDHLKEMSEEWKNLQQQDADLEGSKDEAKAAEFAEKMLETAVEFVRTKEEVEAEHAESAHEKLERALEREHALEAIVHEAHHDATDADQIINTYETDPEIMGEDLEKRREEAVADISHRVEDYAASRLDEAKHDEIVARSEEQAAKETLQELEEREKDLELTLKELKALKKELKQNK